MRLLLTGSNGFIGSHTVACAQARGWYVIGMGRSPHSASPVDRYIHHDLSHPIPAGLIPTVDAVIHCAALASPWAHPREFITANVHGTRHLAHWAANHGAPPFAYVSSSSVMYRNEHQHQLTPHEPLPSDHEQLNAYARTKLIGERITQQYPGTTTILRPRAVFGATDPVLLPRILRIASRGIFPIMEPATGPTIWTDLTDVHTTAEYLVRAIERHTHGTYILTNNEPVQLYPFLFDLLHQIGLRPKPVRVPVGVVRTIAQIGESTSAWWGDYREPPITHFGVSVLSQSKTFDVTDTLRTLGEPARSLTESVERIIATHG